MTKSIVYSALWRGAKEADQRCFVHSLTLSFCVGVVHIKSTRYGYITVIITAVIIIAVIIIAVIIIIIK